MCGEIHERHHHDCICNKLCGIIRLIMAGIIIGTAAGMVLMYFYDHDKWLQCKTRKMVKDAQNAAKNIESTIKSKIGMGGESGSHSDLQSN